MKLRKSVWVALLLAVLVVPSLTGCVANVLGTSCNFQVNNPHQSSGKPKYMDAKATLVCDGQVENLSGTIKLQQYVGGKWKDSPGTQRTQTFPRANANQKLTVQTADKLCTNGKFRAAARGSGSRGGKPAQSIAWQYSQTVVIKCKH